MKKPTVKITKSSSTIYVRCPYDSSWVNVAWRENGKWLPKLKVWRFLPETNARKLKKELKLIFGYVESVGF